MQLGTNITKGLGAGANPEIGRQSALEDRDRDPRCPEGADMVFITAGMGGGTGTGVQLRLWRKSPRELGALTVAVVTKPFPLKVGNACNLLKKALHKLSQCGRFSHHYS